MKRIFTLVLALCLVFALAACGGSKTAAGSWQAKVNLADIAGDELGDMAGYFKDVNVDVNLEMRTDKTFTLNIDAASAAPAMKDGMRAYVEDMLGQMGLTAEDYEAQSGKTLDAIIDEALSEFNSGELSQTFSGTYTDEGGKLLLSADDGSTNTGTWEEDVLTLDVETIGQLAFTRK